MSTRALCLLLLLASGGCGPAPAPRAPPTAAQRFNGEGLRRLERGDLAGASEMFRDALREAELVDDLLGQAEAWNNLGALASARGQHREAWASHASALRFYRLRGGRDPGEIRARSNLAGAMLMAGSVAEAEEQFRAAAALARELDQPAAGAMARVGLAAAALRRGDAASAAKMARAEADDAQKRGDGGAQAAALSIEGAALEVQGDLASARARHDEALALDRKREQPRAVLDDLLALARLSERQGDRPAASSYQARASRIARRMGELELARDLLRKAIATAGPGDEAAALQVELDALTREQPR